MDWLQSARVLVIGGSSGIGLATAAAALAQGADVTIASRSPGKMAQAAAALGTQVGTLAIDLTTDAGVTGALAGTGPWDHVAVTAGMGIGDAIEKGRQGKVREIPLDEAGTSFNVKFWGGYRVAATVDLRPGGSLTFVTGVYSYRPAPGRAMAAAAGAALETLARHLALEMAPSRVNVVAPGLTDTPLWDRLPEDVRQARYAEIAAKVPARRVGTADDVAQIILMFMTNPQLTGATILSDGGFTLL